MQPDSNDIVFRTYGLDLGEWFERGISVSSGAPQWWIDFLQMIATVWSIYSVIAFLLSFIFILITIYAYLKINEYSEIISDRLAVEERAWRELHGARDENTRWNEVLRHAGSDRPNDWRLSIIEADIMLGEALTESGYAGTTIGEQLRGISPNHLQSVQDAWDAHRIRNRIAHEGADFILTQAMTREAIVKYERALKELGMV